jgi:two-component system nitrate/nitrite response regulator NarL
MLPQISVLISEPEKMYCDLLVKAFHEVRARFRIVGSACSTAEILAALQENSPQVAIISSSLRDGPQAGIRILPMLRKSYPGTRLLVTVGSLDRELVVESFRLGADGVFCRNDPFDALCKSVEVVSQGQVWANVQQLRFILDALTKAPKQVRVHPVVEKQITKRESAVVRLAVEGLSNREIAQQLALTEHTVKNYLFRVFEKLGVSNRVELVLSCLHQEEDAREKLAAESELAASKIKPTKKVAIAR